MFGRNGEPDRRTDYSVEKSEEDVNLEELSFFPHRNGKMLVKEKGCHAINMCNLIFNSEDFPSWKDNAEDLNADAKDQEQ